MRTRGYLLHVLTIALCFLMLTACASLQGAKPMTAKQQASIWIGIYNAQYDDTMSILTNPAAPAAQKDIAWKKKQILSKVWPLLKVYVSVVDNSGVPTSQDTAQLVELINQLTILAGGE